MTATAGIILAFLVILILCPIIVRQNEKITEIEEKLKEMENTTDAKEQALLDAGAEILQLERNITKTAEKLSETERELTEVAEKLEEILEEALERAKVFEAEHNRTIDRVSTLEAGHREMADNLSLTRNELTTTREMLTVRVGDLENTLSITAAALETEQNRTIDRLLALEASYQEVATSLSLTRDELNITRVVLQGRAQDIENTLTNTTARTAAIEGELERMESDIETLNATKASREAVDERLAELNMVKADRSEVAVLSDNLTVLEEASSREDEDIWQELRVLADNTLNHSHYDHLQQALQHLQSSKASQIDFENLSSEVEVLANNTVRTDTFLSSIDTVENTTLELQQNIHELELNITSLNGTVHQISATLINNLTALEVASSRSDEDILQELRVLADNTLNYTHYDHLQQALQHLQSSKASQIEFENLSFEVEVLANNTVRSDTFLSSIGTVENTTLLLQQSIHDFTSLNGTVHQISASLSESLTALEEASSREDEDIWQELRALADNTLNHSHYDHLQQALQHLQLSKASQTDFENLLSEVEVLANNTVRTDTFLSSIDTVENTTLLLQQSIHELELNFTSLNGTVYQISAILINNLTALEVASSREDEDILQELRVLADNTLNYTHYDHLQQELQQLQSSKASQIEFENLLSEVEVLANNTVRSDTFLSSIGTVGNTTLLLQQSIHDLRLNFTSLNGTVHQISASLSDNLTALEEASSREDEDIWQELRALADNTLNHSHYDHLQQALQHLQLSKASQTDFENLSSEVEVLANNTVRTDTFLSSIDTVENTTLLLQQSIHELELNFTSLNGTVYQISATLINNLTALEVASSREDEDILQELRVLADNTLNYTHYDHLQQELQHLQSSKASQIEFENLLSEVEVLANNTVRSDTFLSSIGTVGNTTLLLQQSIHDLRINLTSLNGTVHHISATLTTNTGNIDSNSDRITELENASPRLTASWMTTMACVSVILVTVFVPLHT